MEGLLLDIIYTTYTDGTTDDTTEDDDEEKKQCL